MNKVASLSQIIKTLRNSNKKIGLVVGSFDIVHMGHINLLKFAKKHVDTLVVGLDNDKTIKLVKGINRPVNNLRKRSMLLEELESIDFIFEIKKTSHHDSEEALKSYESIIKKLKPTHIFTHKICDRHWKRKKAIADKNNITFLLDKSTKITNSGIILELITKDF